MSIIEKAKECEKFELEPIFRISKNLKKLDEQHQVLKFLIFRAEELKEEEFIYEKVNNLFKNKKYIEKKDNEILMKYLYSNIRTERYQKNIELYENFSIDYDFFLKNKILNIFSYSYIELFKYSESIEILEKIKNEDPIYFENYVDVLIKDKQFEHSEKILKNYFPKKDKHKIWKAMNLANLYFKKKDYKNLKIYTEKALKIFLKYRVTKDEIEHATYYYYFGIFYEQLNEKLKAKEFFERSINFETNLLVELKYKKLSKSKLEQMEVNLK